MKLFVRGLVAVMLTGLASLPAMARDTRPARPRYGVPQAPPLSPVEACLAAITAAEQAYRTPPGLLLAIAQTESGRFDRKTGQVQPWPWTMNFNGAGIYVASKEEAVTQATEAAKQPKASTDVGCMQVNTQQHPTAFATLQDAFDPNSNAIYAAKFLTQLYAQTGDWVQATGYYHSHTPELAIPYRTAVQARMQPGHLLIAKAAPPSASPEEIMRENLRNAWAATLTSSAPSLAAISNQRIPAKPQQLAASGVFSRLSLR